MSAPEVWLDAEWVKLPDGTRVIRYKNGTWLVVNQPTPCAVLDPFSGAGTVGLVASRLGRDYIGIELNPKYAEMSRQRIHNDAPLFSTDAA